MARSSERVQELLAEKLAQQDADREVIGGIIDRYTQTPSKEDDEYNISGLPEAEEGVIAPILSAFAPLKAKQTKAPESTYGEPFYRVTGGFDGDAVTTERPLTSYKSGEYDYKLGEPPIITGLSDLAKFGDRALFGTPEEKAEAKKQVKQVVKGLPQILPELTESTIKSARNIEEGSITTKDEDTGQITRPTEYLYNMGSTLGGIGAGTARSIARTAGDGPDGQVLGIMGGGKMKSGPKKLEELKEFETKAAKKGLRPLPPRGGFAKADWESEKGIEYDKSGDYRDFYAPFWEAQREAGDNLRVFRSVIDEMPAIEIDTSRAQLKRTGPLYGPTVVKRPEIGEAHVENLTGSWSGDPVEANVTTLDQVLSLPKLFEEYPHLKETTVQWSPDAKTASYRHSTETIELGPSYRYWLESKDSETETPERKKWFAHNLLGSVLHETQHAIDHFEQRESGYNPRIALSDAEQKFIGVGSPAIGAGIFEDDAFRTPSQERRYLQLQQHDLGDRLKNEAPADYFDESLTGPQLGINLEKFSDVLKRNPDNLANKIKEMYIEQPFMRMQGYPRYFDLDQNGKARFSANEKTYQFLDSIFKSELGTGSGLEKNLMMSDFDNEFYGQPKNILQDPAAYATKAGLNDASFEIAAERIKEFVEKFPNKLGKIDQSRRTSHIQDLLEEVGDEYYVREGGEVKARLADFLRTGQKLWAQGFDSPRSGQRKNLENMPPNLLGDTYKENLLLQLEKSFPDVDRFTTKENIQHQFSPREQPAILLHNQETVDNRRKIFPEYLYDVEPADIIYPLEKEDRGGSRSKTQRALNEFPKIKKAHGGPVNNRVNELLDATFRK